MFFLQLLFPFLFLFYPFYHHLPLHILPIKMSSFFSAVWPCTSLFCLLTHRPTIFLSQFLPTPSHFQLCLYFLVLLCSFSLSSSLLFSFTYALPPYSPICLPPVYYAAPPPPPFPLSSCHLCSCLQFMQLFLLFQLQLQSPAVLSLYAFFFPVHTWLAFLPWRWRLHISPKTLLYIPDCILSCPSRQ